MSRRSCLLLAATLAGLGLLVLSWGAPAERASLAAGEEKPAAKETKPPATGPGGLPLTGKGVAALAPLDVAIEKIMLRHGIPGAALAITKDGKLVYARGYGWGLYEKGEAATPETLFGLASVSKCFTALAALKLVEEGKLRLDDKAFELLKHLKPPPRAAVDPRLAKVTVRQLLDHSGGWDRDKSGDPANWSFQVSRALGVRMPITEDHLIRYMRGVRLDFDPGTKAVYSNFGYIMLGQVVAKVSGQPYEQYVRAKVLKPMGIEQARLHDRDGRYFKGEARRYNAGLMHALPAFNMPWTDATGGWAASVVDLARMMTALDGSRGGKAFLRADLMKEMLAPPPPPQKPLPDGTHFGLGWDKVQKSPKGDAYYKGGCWTGVRASVKRRFDGVHVALLYNAVVQMDPLDQRVASDAIHEAQEAVAAIKDWPKIDLFKEYR